jgi:hypothetical protein
MASSSFARAQVTPGNAYDQLLLRAMAVACLLFPLLYLGSAVFYALDPGTFFPEPYEWMGGNDVEQYGLLWLAWYAGLAAILGVSRLLKEAQPRLAAWAALLVFIGGLTQVGFMLQMLGRNALRRVPFETYHTVLLIDQSPVYIWSLSVLLWMIGLVMLGIGVWRSAVLPRWVGALLVVGTLAFFMWQGPGGAVSSVIPLIGFPLGALCFLLAFPVVGWTLWRNVTEMG